MGAHIYYDSLLAPSKLFGTCVWECELIYIYTYEQGTIQPYTVFLQVPSKVPCVCVWRMQVDFYIADWSISIQIPCKLPNATLDCHPDLWIICELLLFSICVGNVCWFLYEIGGPSLCGLLANPLYIVLSIWVWRADWFPYGMGGVQIYAGSLQIHSRLSPTFGRGWHIDFHMKWGGSRSTRTPCEPQQTRIKWASICAGNVNWSLCGMWINVYADSTQSPSNQNNQINQNNQNTGSI